MIKKYLPFLLLFCLQTVHSQIVNIPDANFKSKLLASTATGGAVRDQFGNYMKLDANSNGQIEYSEAALAGSLIIVGNPNPVNSVQGLEAFVNVNALVFQYNSFPALNLSGYQYLESLECRNNQLTSVDVSSCPELEFLDISLNPVTTLNVANSTNLYSMIVEFTDITTLDLSGFDNLFILKAQQTNLSSLNLSGCNSLDSVDLFDHNLVSLDVSGLTSLRDLDCHAGPMTTLNVSDCNALENLYCVDNQLSELDLSGLSNLEEANCGGNILTSLTLDGCVALKTLWCDSNQLESVDLSPVQNLIELNANYNQIATLEISGLQHLNSVDLSFNAIAAMELQNLPALQTLNLYQNQLLTIDVQDCPVMNGVVMSSNPNLISVFAKTGNNTNVGFQNCANLQYLCVDASRVASVQTGIASQGLTNCHVNSYCSFTPGGNYYTMQGVSRFDYDNDGCDDADSIFPTMKFSFSNGSVSGNYIADGSGNYRYDVQQGTHTIAPVMENPTYFNVSPTSLTIPFPENANPNIQDFCITSNGVHPDLEIFIVPIDVARPGFDADYKVIYKNAGNQMLSGTISVSFNDAIVDVISSLPMYSQMSANFLSYDFTNLNIFESREILFSVNVNSPMEIPAVNGGDILNYIASISSAGIDETPNNNSFTLNQTVLNSFDPNDKTCLEGSVVGPDKIGQYVHYQIRFENTGTFAAENIVVKDVIDMTKFNISSLIPLSGSHPFTTRITETNKVEFIFENINLPFDDANNDGYVTFKIKTNPTLVVGNTFSNTASIYFDYNFPIITNPEITTISALSNPDFELSNYITVFPNPATDKLNISKSAEIGISLISVYNVIGQQLIVIPNAVNVDTIDVSTLGTGTYFLKVTSDKGTSATKFVKQ